MEEALRNILEDSPGGDKGGEGVSKADKIQALNLLIKIVANILSPPSSKTAIEMERYRCINSHSASLQQRLLRHGPAYEYLLIVMGFVRLSNPPVHPGVLQNPNQEYFYLSQNADLDDLNRNLQLLKQALARLQDDSYASLTSSSSPLSPGLHNHAALSLSSSSSSSPGDHANSSSSSFPKRETSGSGSGGDQQGTETGANLPMRGSRITTTSRAIRGSPGSTHTRNQEELRRLREQQRERFEQTSQQTEEGGPGGGGGGWFSSGSARNLLLGRRSQTEKSIPSSSSAQGPSHSGDKGGAQHESAAGGGPAGSVDTPTTTTMTPPTRRRTTLSGSRGRDGDSHGSHSGVSRFFRSLFTRNRSESRQRGDGEGGGGRSGGTTTRRGLGGGGGVSRMKTLKDLPPPPRRGGG
ncbi:pub domain protein [Cystoisospora suis]|uniref:Pub domain protein n=1 Tax=Cystoisospora suis TaxID=483139 RepID=A0A2C6KPT4_9APIC|nr:pub domain protein [Cystoisospora suis]